MIALWPWVSRAAAAFGLGVLPLSWAPVSPVPAPVQLLSFAWGFLMLLFSVWTDFQALATTEDRLVVLYSISRVFLLFLTVWWSHAGLFKVTSQLEQLCCRFPKYDRPRDLREIYGSLIFLAVLNFAFNKELSQANGGYSVGFVIFDLMDKNLNLLVPALYIMLVNEFTYLFRKVDHLWKQELDLLLSGSIDSKLQVLRIFHTEISLRISDLMRALGTNMLLYFAFTFGDVLLAFYHYSNGRGETYFMLAIRVLVSTTAILLIVRCTQRTVDAVELLLQKLAFRPVKVDVCGMFTINKQLILEIIMGATTCCNAMVQLKPYVIMQQFNSNTTQNITETSTSESTTRNAILH